MTPAELTFPVDPLLDDIASQLAQHPALLLTAEPGAGKTTRVPLHLLKQAWLADQTIVMLEPRRLAARNAARYMAQQLGEQVGETVGYRIRLEQRESANTRLLVVTEGILTRMLQQDPELSGVGLIIFDEFHERHLSSDLALALSQQCQQVWREDLKLLVMSATLDTDSLTAKLAAPVIHCPGRGFPVELFYRPKQQSDEPLARQVCRTVAEVLGSGRSGHILVFLPGTADIRRLQEQLQQQYENNEQLLILPLHGQLDDQQQKRALQDPPAGQRKILLATNIAESSLTLNGVDCVIDSGLERRMEFSPASGLGQLRTRDISQASATQRMGRAGRQRAGVCYRLWPESTHHTRPAHIEAEIRHSDLTPLLLELLLWGAQPDELVWLDFPPAAALAQARQLLYRLGYLEQPDSTQLSGDGAAAARLGMEPRWASALLQAQAHGSHQRCAELAAILQEWPHQQRRSDDIERLFQYASQQKLWQQRVKPLANRWLQQLPTRQPAFDTPYSLADCCLLAFPERLAQRRSNSTNGSSYRMANGVGVELQPDSDLHGHEWLVILDLTGGTPNRVRAALSISQQELAALLQQHPHWLSSNTVVDWQQQGTLLAERQQKIGQLVWQKQTIRDLSAADWRAAWLDYFAHPSQGLQRLGKLDWSDDCHNLRQRVALLRQYQVSQTETEENWPDWSDAGLLTTVADWLLPWLDNCRNERQLKALDMLNILKSSLSWQQQQQLDDWLPTHWQVPSGSRITIDYSQTPPRLSVKLQEMFGEPTQPAVLKGNLKLTLQLLSPGRKPLQLTQDLPNFWQNAYKEVRKEMRGRYPKHPWPEDPLSAEATALTKRALQRRDNN
ncbi:ATP-dependent helicase HrpB [Oceanobacter mangrovi]|uniref:ATP-dependent helicase HrpB n=1 Tax=Oceanobacter mangrovi TaxID=2862510 RepID=UPI001C8E1DFB|nr:ATP-dependent helicase HrpB [Oceanobacter mangrovi]